MQIINQVYQKLGIMIKQLSTRQNEMVAELADGYTVKEIAARKFLSPYTVDTHLKTSKAKTGAKTLAHLTAIYVKSCIACLFLAIQFTICIKNPDIDLRRPSRTSRTSRTIRKNS